MTTQSSSAPPNSPRRMPPVFADSATVWAFLEKGLNDIMANVQTDQFGLMYQRHMSLYTAAYDYCTSSRMHGAPDSAANAGNCNTRQLRSSDLYDKLVGYFAHHVKGVKEQSDRLHDEVLLRHYAGEWDRYTVGVGYINRLFTFLNRHWAKPAQNEGRAGVYPIYTLALVQWKSIFFLDVQNKLAGIIHRLIESERNGKTINRGHIKKVIDSFVSLGLDELDVNKTSVDVCQEHLESLSLEAT